MAKGYSLLGRAMARQGVDTAFFIMGGPINDAVKAMQAEGIRAIDVRHELATAEKGKALLAAFTDLARAHIDALLAPSVENPTAPSG